MKYTDMSFGKSSRVWLSEFYCMMKACNYISIIKLPTDKLQQWAGARTIWWTSASVRAANSQDYPPRNYLYAGCQVAWTANSL